MVFTFLNHYSMTSERNLTNDFADWMPRNQTGKDFVEWMPRNQPGKDKDDLHMHMSIICYAIIIIILLAVLIASAFFLRRFFRRLLSGYYNNVLRFKKPAMLQRHSLSCDMNGIELLDDATDNQIDDEVYDDEEIASVGNVDNASVKSVEFG